ncbi:hypothetical protein L4C50_20740 [Aliivibrio sifiae]
MASVFSLSAPNQLKPSRLNGVKNVSVFHSLYLAIQEHFVRLIAIGKLESGLRKYRQGSSLPSWPSRK